MIDKARVRRSLEELLTIARVAMPPDLFAQDPRVARAQALLAELTGAASFRVPTIPRHRPDEVEEMIADASAEVDLTGRMEEALND